MEARCLSSFLNNGTILASLQSCDTSLVSIDAWNMSVKIEARWFAADFKINDGIQSGPRHIVVPERSLDVHV